MLSRIQCALLALSFCTSLVGCAEGDHVGDWLWWPGFNKVTTGYVYQVPVHDVALNVQCEIFDFLEEEKKEFGKAGPQLLDPNKGAGVILILQTDLSGSVQYVGVDLSKLGLSNLAELVAATSAMNKAPSLQAKGTGKTTVSAEVDFTVVQSETGPKTSLTVPPQTPVKETDLNVPSTVYENANFKEKAPGKFTATPASLQSNIYWPKEGANIYWPNAQTVKDECKQPPYSLRRPYLRLWLQNWLAAYRSYGENSIDREPFICNTKVTLKSAFQLVVDVSAGVNVFSTPPIILPISGFNVDASPDYTHSVEVSFALQDQGDSKIPKVKDQKDGIHSAYCKAIGAGTQPSTK